MDDVFCHQHCVCCAPGLFPVGVYFEARRNLVEFLGDEDKLQGSAVDALYIAVFFLYEFFELLLEVLTYDVNYFSEAGENGVIN